MKKILLSIVACFALFAGTAQTQIFYEDFESGAGAFTLNTGTEGSVTGTAGTNFWIANSDYSGGAGTVQTCAPLLGTAFTIPVTPAQPGGIANANGGYVHIISDEANTNGIYSASLSPAENLVCVFAASHFIEFTSDINTSNFTGVTLDFWWLNASSVSAHGEVWYSVDGGSNWTEKTGTNYTGTSTWTNTMLTDVNWDGQSTLRFGFRFDNVNANSVADPALSIDDIEVYGTLSSPCSQTNSLFLETACFTYTVPSGDETYNTPGAQTVMDTILNVSGCDSVMTISLTINDVDTNVTAAPDHATAQATSATFQWLDCDNSHAVVVGATSDTFSPTANGNYAVEVTQNGCVDTSSCYALQTASINEFESASFKVYPNPTSGEFSIDLTGLKGDQKLSIVDTKGSVIFTEVVSSGKVVQYKLQLENGIYIVKLVDQHGIIRRSRLMIE